jgi:hypothetical protein
MIVRIARLANETIGGVYHHISDKHRVSDVAQEATHSI